MRAKLVTAILRRSAPKFVGIFLVLPPPPPHPKNGSTQLGAWPYMRPLIFNYANVSGVARIFQRLWDFDNSCIMFSCFRAPL